MCAKSLSRNRPCEDASVAQMSRQKKSWHLGGGIKGGSFATSPIAEAIGG
jgi:hypothetical protein